MCKPFNDVNSRWASIANEYNQYRIKPPVELVSWMADFWSVEETPDLVADIGCGTGLSTRPWAAHAKRVIGIDPSEEMLAISRSKNLAENVTFQIGFGSNTGFQDNSVDIVTAMHSIHWMEPKSTLIEIQRVLKGNGLLIVYGYELSPTSQFLEVEHKLFTLKKKIGELTLQYGLEKDIYFYKDIEFFNFAVKEKAFLYNRYFYFSEVIHWDSNDYLGWIYTLGNVQKLRKDVGLSDEEIGISRLRAVVEKHFQSQKKPLIITWKVFLFKNKISKS